MAKDTSYDLVQWRERKWNGMADELANRAMDSKGDLSWWTGKHHGTEINIMAFVDGGRRLSGESAFAFAVFVIRNGLLRLIGYGAAYIHDEDSFLAECRSMHIATETLRAKLTEWSFTYVP